MYLPESQTHDMPLAAAVLYQVAVTDTLNYKGSFVSVSNDGVFGVSLKFSPHAFTACVGYHMSVLRAALRSRQIVVLSDLVEMRAFKISAARALPYALACGQLSARRNIYLALYHAAYALVVRSV